AAFILGTALIVFLVAPGALSPQDGVPASGTPTSYRRDGNLLTVFDAEGRRLWVHRSPFDLSEKAYAGGRQKHPVLFEDLDGDGRVEVLFTAFGVPFEDHILYCFEADGTQRFAWKYEGVKHFGETTYAAPWALSQVFVDRSRPGGAALWVVIHHAPWFPSALMKLDAHGTITAEFWNDGAIHPVTPSRIGGRDVLLVGGGNNEFRSGFLAVVDPDRPSGSAPALRPDYTCLDCPAGRPVRYIVFPRSAITRETDVVGSVMRIAMDGAGQSTVMVENFGSILPGDADVAGADSYYTFDEKLNPMSAETGEGYRRLHRRLQLDGAFTRPYGEEDERELWPLREWNGSDFVPLPPPRR
ncbi:MAG TPA: hypothetical protein VK911_08225, partial [Vicinamibacterales bacterium]|nr:hypothetical protein [Vicinamibacterales bacterium]